MDKKRKKTEIEDTASAGGLSLVEAAGKLVEDHKLCCYGSRGIKIKECGCVKDCLDPGKLGMSKDSVVCLLVAVYNKFKVGGPNEDLTRSHYRRFVKPVLTRKYCYIWAGSHKGLKVQFCEMSIISLMARLPDTHETKHTFRRLNDALEEARGGRHREQNRVFFYTVTGERVRSLDQDARRYKEEIDKNGGESPANFEFS